MAIFCSKNDTKTRQFNIIIIIIIIMIDLSIWSIYCIYDFAVIVVGGDIFAASIVSTRCYVRAGRPSEDPSVPGQTGKNQTKKSLM